MHFKFDQPDIEVDAVYFQRIVMDTPLLSPGQSLKSSVKIVPSSICVSFYNDPLNLKKKCISKQLRPNSEDYLIFITSYSTDQQLIKLSPVFPQVEEAEQAA